MERLVDAALQRLGVTTPVDGVFLMPPEEFRLFAAAQEATPQERHEALQVCRGQRARGQTGAYRAVAEALSTLDKPAFATGAVKSRGQAVAAEPYMLSYLEDLYTDGNEDVKAAVRAAWVLTYGVTLCNDA